MNDQTKKQDIECLNGLLSLCIDSSKGYREAAEQCKTPSLAEMFRSRATERDQIAMEFKGEVRKLGGTPNEHGTAAGSAHRLILDVRAMVGSNAKASIDEVERGEDFIKAAFEKAIKRTDVSQSVTSLVTQCYSSIKAGHDQMSALKHATK
jgi:uncharacterized protein (TIGR02284 family)